MNKKKKFLLVFISILIAWYLYTMLEVRFYSKKYYETKSDVAIVLGAGTHDSILSPVFKERLEHSINLFNKKVVSNIILTGGYGDGQKISDSKVAMNYLVSKDIPISKILIEEKSTITFTNIINANKLMEDHQLKTALIISDPYHMKRSIEMCKKVGMTALPSPTPTTMYQRRKTKADFLIKETMNFCLFKLFERYRSTEYKE
jgi:uncharacterized SAM-binding protein YcdF (DUF218 family)